MIILQGKLEIQAVCAITQEITNPDNQIRLVSESMPSVTRVASTISLPPLSIPYVDLVLCSGLLFIRLLLVALHSIFFSSFPAQTFEIQDLCALPLDGVVLAAGS